MEICNQVTYVFDAAPVLKSVLTLRQYRDRWTQAERIIAVGHAAVILA
jgi:hypothetical protein